MDIGTRTVHIAFQCYTVTSPWSELDRNYAEWGEDGAKFTPAFLRLQNPATYSIDPGLFCKY